VCVCDVINHTMLHIIR